MSSILNPSSKPKPLSYTDAIRVFNDDDVVECLKETYQKLSQSSVALLKTFDSICTQLHTFDMQTSSTTKPLKPKWQALQKEFSELTKQQRVNAGFISGRLKMFCTVILPLSIRDSGARNSRGYQEKIQILQSFMNISSDHIALTRTLVESSINLNTHLTSFNAEFTNAANHKTASQDNIQDLTPKFCELENTVREIYFANGQVTEPDVTLLVFSALRMPLSGRTRSKVSHKQLLLSGPELTAIKKLYEDLDYTRNGIAHSHYNSQVLHRTTDIATTARMAISSLVVDEILSTESVLSFFVSIWARLQADCLDILQWLQDSRDRSHVPFCIKSYMESGHTIYLPVADALDACSFGAELPSANRHL